jgi:hypothetical protein
MDPIFKKLNYKGQTKIHVWNAPASFQPILKSLEDDVQVKTSLNGKNEVEFFIGFADKQAVLNEMMDQLASKLGVDATMWFCYPKGSSKLYTCDFNRDTGWSKAGAYGWEPVRQVAIDADWSALRFRQVEHIKQMNRASNMALSELGKKRTSQHQR